MKLSLPRFVASLLCLSIGLLQAGAEQDLVTRQLAAIVDHVEGTSTRQSATPTEQAARIKRLSERTRTRVLEHLIEKTASNKEPHNQNEYPFVVTPNTKRNQFSMFLLLTKELMSPDETSVPQHKLETYKQLAHKLGNCVEQTNIMTIGMELQNCAGLLAGLLPELSAETKEKLNPRGWQEKMRLANKIQWRLNTGAKPNERFVYEAMPIETAQKTTPRVERNAVERNAKVERVEKQEAPQTTTAETKAENKKDISTHARIKTLLVYSLSAVALGALIAACLFHKQLFQKLPF